MPLKVQIELYDTVEFVDGRRLYIGSDDDEVLRFQSPNSKSLILLDQDRFLRLLGRGEIRLLRTMMPSTRPRHSRDDRVVVDPNTSPMKLKVGEAVLFYVMRHDRTIDAPTGPKGLAKFISHHSAEAFRRGHDLRISVAQLRRGLSKGTVGTRNLAAMISQQGEGSRNVTPPEIKRAYETAVRFFYSERDNTRRGAFSILKKELQKLIDKGYIYRGELLTLPKRGDTLRKYIDDALDYETLNQKKGKDEADALVKGSKSVLTSKIPFEYVIIDHTVLDTMAIDDQTGLPLGRPILAIAIDVFSRCIVGFHISFEPPSISTLLTLIKIVATDKDHLADLLPEGERHGLSQGKIGTVYLDRALENLSDALTDSCAELGIDVDFCPRKNGKAKSPGERVIETFNDALFHVLPGAVAHGPTEMRRLQLNPTFSATMTLSEIIAVTYTEMVQYEQRWHRGIKAIPCLKLLEGYAKHGQPMFDDIRVLENQIGDTKEVNLWHYGIDFKGERFVNPNGTTEIRNAELGRQRAAGKIRPSNRQQAVKVKIKFNPADCSVIHVHFKRGKTWDYIPFHNENTEYSKGKSFKLSREIRLYAREQGYKFEHERDRIMAAARHMQHIQSLFKRGKLTRAQKRALTKLNELHREAANEADQEESGKLANAEMISATSTPFGKPMGTPSADRQDSATRRPGIQRGRRKAAVTRARNAKLKADDFEQNRTFIDAPDEEQISAADEEQLDYTFTSLRKSK